MTPQNHLDITLFGREYRLACPPDQQPALRAAVALVDTKMQEISGKNRQISVERAAIMAAITLAHELQDTHPSSAMPTISTSDLSTTTQHQLNDMVQRVSAAIETHQKDLF